MALIKTPPDRYLEITDPAKAMDLWSHRVFRDIGLTPVGRTLETLHKIMAWDVIRWETWPEAKEMMAAKGWKKSPARKLQEYAAQYGGEVEGRRLWQPQQGKLNQPVDYVMTSVWVLREDAHSARQGGARLSLRD